MNARKIFPNYRDGSIVNLMSTIGTALRARSFYKPVGGFGPVELKEYRNIVLCVLDGFGYEQVRRYGRSLFTDFMRRSLTTVFPSTTAAAITTLATGLAPQQHALVGWHMYLREMGVAALILPFIPRYRGESFVKSGIDPQAIYEQESFDRKISVEPFLVSGTELIHEHGYNSCMFQKSKKLGYETLDGYFLQIARAVRSSTRRKYVHAYWPIFDALCHLEGVGSAAVRKHFFQLEKGFQRLKRTLSGTNTAIIITADHGLIDVPEKNVLRLEDHPVFRQAVVVPVTGDARIPYLYVRASRVSAFRTYFRRHFSSVWRLHSGEELIQKNYYGLFQANPKLFDRVGDFVMLTEKPYVLKELVLGEPYRKMIGFHGGLTADEMLVPLIVIPT